MTVSRVHFSSDKNDWGTPQNIRDAVFAFVGSSKVMDPCPGLTPVGAPLVKTGKDGLAVPWPEEWLLYVNPPYGRAIKAWINKCSVEGSAGREIIALVPARPDTQWFYQALRTSQRTCFIRGRLRFVNALHDAPFPSVVFYWGRRIGMFAGIFSALGNIVVPLDDGGVIV